MYGSPSGKGADAATGPPSLADLSFMASKPMRRKMATPADLGGRLPLLVSTYLGRALSQQGTLPSRVRVHQSGEMWRTPGKRPMRFKAIEDFAVDQVAFSWRARFPLVGPVAVSVLDELAKGEGELRVSLLGIPLGVRKGTETSVGEAMRYLAELPWVPQAIAANAELEWREIGDRRVDVSCPVGEGAATVSWEFDEEGDPARVTGLRPFPARKMFVPTRWGGDFGGYEIFAGFRIPTAAEVWWDLPEGRFVYWRGRIIGVELLESG